jgi:hypothetical protein
MLLVALHYLNPTALAELFYLSDVKIKKEALASQRDRPACLTSPAQLSGGMDPRAATKVSGEQRWLCRRSLTRGVSFPSVYSGS